MTIFTEPEEIIREIAFSYILFVSSSKTSRNRMVAILEN